MNTHPRTRLAITLVLSMSFIFAGCRGETVRETPPAPGPRTVRITAVLPLSGPAASLGEYLRRGIELGKEDAEAGGKVKIVVDFLDSKNEPREGVTALQAALARQTPDAVILAMSAVAKAGIPIVEQKGIFTIVTTTALTGLPQGTQTVVRIYPTSEDFVTPVADEMARRFNRVGVLYVDDDFGRRNQEVFTGLITKKAKRITAAEPFALTQLDARATIARLLASKPDAVFVTGYGPAFVAVFKQLREASATLPIYTEIGFANPAVLKGLGPAADGIVFNGTPLELAEPKTPSAIDFKRRYMQRFNDEPYQVAGFAHDAVTMIAQAAAKTSSGKPDKPTVIGLTPFQGVMGEVRHDPHGESRIALQLMKHENGRNVPLAQQ